MQKQSRARKAVIFVFSALLFFLLDTIFDYLTGDGHFFDWHRLIVFGLLSGFFFIFYLDADLLRRKDVENLHATRAQLEAEIEQRTKELQEINSALQMETAERTRVEREREQIFVQAEFARNQAQILSQELQLTNSTFRALIYTMPVGVVLTDSDGVVILANELARSILGEDQQQSSEILSGNCIICRLDGTCYPAELLPLNRALREGVVVTNVEAMLWREDGSKVFILMSASPVREESGLIINAVQIVQDITEIKRMEQKLRESEERYRTQFDIFPEPNTIWDRNGYLLMMNFVSAHNFGGRREQFLGKSILEILGRQAEPLLKRITQVMDSGKPQTFDEVWDLQVGRRFFQITLQRIQNPDGQYVVQMMAYDITDRKQAETALQTSEDKFSTIFHFSPDGIVLIRMADSTIVDVNEACVRLLGYPRSAFLGLEWRKLDFFNESSQGDFVREVFQTDGRMVDQEVILNKYDGSTIYTLLSSITLQIGGEKFAMLIIHDITKRKMSEFALQRIQEELARGAEERVAMKERQRLARELHDSVSQALYGISLGAHTALARLDSDPAQVLEALNYVISLTQAGLTEMRALIFELRPESLEMEGLVVALNKQAAALRARYSLEVDLLTCEEPDLPLAIKEVLYRISQEALHNAVKHARCSKVDVSLDCQENQVALIIQDNGIGFNPDQNFPGHLGLRSMAERAAKAGGDFSVVSAPGAGVRITTLIPVNEAYQEKYETAQG